MHDQYVGLPLLSIHDPEGAGSNSLDPLGLTPIGEQIAVELIPGVRERQSHPRYLTAIAVSHAICQDFAEETVAADSVSEPWQVFEWYVVEGLVRSAGTTSDAKVPGSQKAKKALSQGLPLCASRYLKTPTIFGFHGVYRLLARTLRVEQSDHLADFGFELLDVWQKEQGLQGFYGTLDGPGRNFRQRLIEAVKAGLKVGATNCSGSWFGWKFFFDHLEPTKAGPKEAQLIWRQLRSGTSGYCSEALDFLISKEGQNLMAEKATEKKLYASLKKVVSKDFRTRIEVIQRYEVFCRLLHDAFESCRYEITQTKRGVQPAVLAKLPAVVKAAENLPAAFAEAEQSIPDLTRRTRFQSVFQEVALKRKATDFAVALYEHHKRIQKAKPPEGKAPWLEQHYDGSLLIRPEYQLEKEPKSSAEFVNPYRLNSLWSFAADLKQV
jgi:hypothetical protein